MSPPPQATNADVRAEARRLLRGIAAAAGVVALGFVAAFTAADLMIERLAPPGTRLAWRLGVLVAGVAVALPVAIGLVYRLALRHIAALDQGRDAAETRRRLAQTQQLYEAARQDMAEHQQLDRERLALARLDGALLVARTVAHEINNALSPVLGYAELLAERPPIAADPQCASYLSRIRQSTEEATQMVHRLQRIIRLEEAPSGLGPDKPLLDMQRSTTPPPDDEK